ncbi:Wadjet anti-phage system protein JetD domain-containing protein [Nocardia abscessus]|uniref:Wadjet anti-phage system protein JetD domain-containing protein n=1 Tax=Nocardia abscessus TaxID=120957 RepID=UPI0002FFC983|nr:Wadjet anti-phage system protein JetD domain-containing protein [Nocardia abscessus]MCC3326479.1 DUF2220 family protein [Nocardia abscessus]
MISTVGRRRSEPLPLSESAHYLAAALGEFTERRITKPTILAAFAKACPATAGTTQSRPVLSALLDELAEHRLIELPRSSDGWDRAHPRLPAWLRLPAPPKLDIKSVAATASIVWRGELAWAATAVLTSPQVEVLKTINRWLRDTDGDNIRRTVIPMRERSLDIFRDEKRLDALMTTTLFAPGRLTLATLFATRIPPPLACERIGDGTTVLVIENSDTFETITTLLARQRSNVGYTAFGGGHAFEASVARIATLPQVRDIAYYGDIDNDGLIIPQRANVVAATAGLPPVRPAHGLYQLLLQHDLRNQASAPVDPLDAERRVSWLPADTRERAAQVLVTGSRLAQEATGRVLLGHNDSWHHDL